MDGWGIKNKVGKLVYVKARNTTNLKFYNITKVGSFKLHAKVFETVETLT